MFSQSIFDSAYGKEPRPPKFNPGFRTDQSKG